MARMEPRQELIDLKHNFSQKNCISEFKKLYAEMENYSLEEKLKGGDYEQMISEVSALNLMIDEYKPSHIQWTGKSAPDPHTGKQPPDPSQDGILYFDERKQPVEIVSFADQSQIHAIKKYSKCSQWTLEVSRPNQQVKPIKEQKKEWERNRRQHYEDTLEWIRDDEKLTKQEREQLLSAKKERFKNEKFNPQLDSGVLEDIIYEKMVCVLQKKNKEKYKDFWLLIFYCHLNSVLHDFIEKENIRNYVLNKIQSKQPELICSLENIFKKIKFVPSRKFANHQIFDLFSN